MHPTSNTRNLVLFGVGLGAAHRAQVSCELLSRAHPGTPLVSQASVMSIENHGWQALKSS